MSVLTLIQRWTNKAPQILLSPHDKITDTKLTLDNQHGEYMKFNDLLILLKSGALLELTPELKEIIADGEAHKGLMRDLEQLGYDSFETVMKVLKEQRNTVVEEKEYEIWCEGYRDNGNTQYAFLEGKAKAYSFYEACEKHYSTLEKNVAKEWHFDKAKNKVSIWSMGLYPTKEQAEKFLGPPPKGV